MRWKDSPQTHNFTLFSHQFQILQNDNSPYTLLEVGRPDASRSISETNDVNKVSSKYFTPFNHRMMQSSFDLCQVIFVNLELMILSIINSVLSVIL